MKKIFLILLTLVSFIGAKAQDTIYHVDTVFSGITFDMNDTIYTIGCFNADSTTDSIMLHFIAQRPGSAEWHINPFPAHTDINVITANRTFDTNGIVYFNNYHEWHGCNDSVAYRLIIDTIIFTFDTVRDSNGDLHLITNFDTIWTESDSLIELDSAMFNYGDNYITFPKECYYDSTYIMMEAWYNRLYEDDSISFIIRDVYAVKYWHEVIDTTTQSINDVDANVDIHVYPNPTTNIVNIDGDYSYATIIDRVGRVVNRIDHKVNKIDFSEMPAGIYIINFDNKKFVRINVVK